MPADMIRDTEFAQELIDEGLAKGRVEGAHESTVNVLRHRGIADRQAALIAEALIQEDSAAAATRAAFAEIDELTDLIKGK